MWYVGSGGHEQGVRIASASKVRAAQVADCESCNDYLVSASNSLSDQALSMTGCNHSGKVGFAGLLCAYASLCRKVV